MNVLTFEDIQEHCVHNPCTKEDFIAMMKRCVYRINNRQSSYMVFLRSVNGPIAHPHSLNQLNVLLSQITVGLLTPTPANTITSWKYVPFNDYI
jgi:hypothetical protein